MEGLNDTNRKVYDDMVHYMKLKLQKPFTAPKIIMLIASGIKFLAQVHTMTGPEKKDLVLHALRSIVTESPHIPADEKADILMLIDTFGDNLIEVLVNFAKDAHTFIKSKVKGWSCFKPKEAPPTQDRELGDTQTLAEFDATKKYLKLKFQRPMTGPKVILIIAAGVKYIEHYKNLSGAEKKDVVIHAIRDVIQESDLDATDKGELLGVVDIFADETIDYLVEFGNSMYLKVKAKCCKN